MDIIKAIISLFFLLGEWSIIIIFFLSCFLLRYQANYLIFFIVGFVLNLILNMFLKSMIKQPRPSTSDDLRRLLEKHGLPFAYRYKLTSDSFGMPSGHAETTMFCLAFLYFVDAKQIHGLLYVLVLLILWNRLFFEFHTILQVIVGSLIGVAVAWIFYKLARRGLTGRLTMRKDDNFFGINSL
jgi:membrane-associated phospholipid phosphatase